MLTFCWNGWEGKFFPHTLAALAAAEAQSNGQAAGEAGGETQTYDDRDVYASDSAGSNNDEWVGRTPTSRILSYTPRQDQCLQSFAKNAEAADQSHPDNEDERLEQLKGPAKAISMSLIQQHLAGPPFESPILSYAAMRSVNSKFNTWEEPGSFNNHLPALIYCGQLWIFRFACDSVDMHGLGSSARDRVR